MKKTLESPTKPRKVEVNVMENQDIHQLSYSTEELEVKDNKDNNTRKLQETAPRNFYHNNNNFIDKSPEKPRKNKVIALNDNNINDSRSPVKNNIGGAIKVSRNEVNTEGTNKSHAKTTTFFGHLMKQSVSLENSSFGISSDNDCREFTRRRRRHKKRRVVPVNHY